MQLKTSQHGSLICTLCLVYYHSLLKVQSDLQSVILWHRVILQSEVLLKYVISGVWCLHCRFPVWSGYRNSIIIMQYLLHWTPATVHRLIPWISWPRCRDSPTASGPVVKTSITLSTLTSLLFICVLSLPLWAFLICFCCKTHKHNR